jgi:hypothetical protein
MSARSGAHSQPQAGNRHSQKAEERRGDATAEMFEEPSADRKSQQKRDNGDEGEQRDAFPRHSDPKEKSQKSKKGEEVETLLFRCSLVISTKKKSHNPSQLPQSAPHHIRVCFIL